MIEIGDIKLKNNVALAPMSGVSDLPFRRAVHRFGAGLVVSEMVASEELARERPDVVRRAAGDEEVFPFVIQLAGREAKWMGKGARLAEEAGADIVDINMGCPSRQVTGALSGSALMRNLDHALSLIDAVVAGTSKPVTLKMRLGWDWQNLNAPELAKRAEEAGVKMVTVHGRTRNDFYTGTANWTLISEVKKTVKIPVLVNGDICDVDNAREALVQSGADGVMVGRAATGRPWLPGAIATALAQGGEMQAPEMTVQRDAALAHYKDTIAHYGAPLGVRMARKHLAAYIDETQVEIDNAERRLLRAAICRIASPDRVTEALAAFFEGNFTAVRAIAA